MISVQMDPYAIQQLQERLSELPPRLMAQARQALRPLLYQALQANLQKYFSGSAPAHGHADKFLTPRSGKLMNSVLDSLEITGDGDAIYIKIGSDVKYAAIQEYGGFAGRRGPFKKKGGHRTWIPPRPYLRPTMNDLEKQLPDLVEQAIQQANVAEL
jgi:phage gpG-like protein